MRKTAIIADDVELNRDLLAEILEDSFHVVEAADGLEVLRAVRENEGDVAVLLLDLLMPNMDGFGVLEELKEKKLLDRFPVLVISAESDPATEERCLSLGVADFVAKPFRPSLVRHRIRNATAVFEYNHTLEEKVEEQTGEILRQAEQLRLQNIRLIEQNRDVTELLGNVVEARNRESGTHVRRVKQFTMILADYLRRVHPELNLTEELVRTYGDASVMHDIGKIMISDTVLLKPGKLTPEEFEQMKLHTVYGCEVLENAKHLWDERYYGFCREVCRSHHEKWDGRGYPDGLKGDEIPLVAQIVSIADCYDALTTERPYKKPFPPDTAYEMIMGGQCGAMNPMLLEALTDCREAFAAFVAETSAQA